MGSVRRAVISDRERSGTFCKYPILGCLILNIVPGYLSGLPVTKVKKVNLVAKKVKMQKKLNITYKRKMVPKTRDRTNILVGTYNSARIAYIPFHACILHTYNTLDNVNRYYAVNGLFKDRVHIKCDRYSIALVDLPQH